MTDYQPRVRLTLTQAEAGAAMVMFTSAEAGDLDELMNGDLRRSAAALRALDKLRAAIAAAEKRTADKADRKRAGSHTTRETRETREGSKS